MGDHDDPLVGLDKVLRVRKLERLFAWCTGLSAMLAVLTAVYFDRKMATITTEPAVWVATLYFLATTIFLFGLWCRRRGQQLARAED